MCAKKAKMNEKPILGAAPITAKSGGKKKRTGLMVALIVVAVLLLYGAVFAVVLVRKNTCRAGFAADGGMCSNTSESCQERSIDGNTVTLNSGATEDYDSWLSRCFYYTDSFGNTVNCTSADVTNGLGGACSCAIGGCAAKPIIYLYPTRTEKVTVKVSNPQNFIAQYPTYGGGWQMTAQPNGDLTDAKTGRELYALYYESKNVVSAQVQADGFVVRGSDTADFLAKTLPRLGLNARESEEFIIYWLPILQKNPYNYIRFESLSEINANQKLDISPAPDTLIRVMMSYKPLSRTEAESLAKTVAPQQITMPARAGFVVVEWGGTQIGGKAVK